MIMSMLFGFGCDNLMTQPNFLWFLFVDYDYEFGMFCFISSRSLFFWMIILKISFAIFSWFSTLPTESPMDSLFKKKVVKLNLTRLTH